MQYFRKKSYQLIIILKVKKNDFNNNIIKIYHYISDIG